MVSETYVRLDVDQKQRVLADLSHSDDSSLLEARRAIREQGLVSLCLHSPVSLFARNIAE
jgi:hypothetical protein